jgi:hypothetical protein
VTRTRSTENRFPLSPDSEKDEYLAGALSSRALGPGGPAAAPGDYDSGRPRRPPPRGLCPAARNDSDSDGGAVRGRESEGRISESAKLVLDSELDLSAVERT